MNICLRNNSDNGEAALGELSLYSSSLAVVMAVVTAGAGSFSF